MFEFWIGLESWILITIHLSQHPKYQKLKFPGVKMSKWKCVRICVRADVNWFIDTERTWLTFICKRLFSFTNLFFNQIKTYTNSLSRSWHTHTLAYTGMLVGGGSYVALVPPHSVQEQDGTFTLIVETLQGSCGHQGNCNKMRGFFPTILRSGLVRFNKNTPRIQAWSHDLFCSLSSTTMQRLFRN